MRLFSDFLDTVTAENGHFKVDSYCTTVSMESGRIQTQFAMHEETDVAEV